MPRAAHACSVCLAGDPIFDAHGAGVMETGKFSAYFEVLGLTKRSGVLPGEREEGAAGGGGEEPFEDNDSLRVRMLLAWAPLDRFTVSLDLPAAFTEITEHEGGETTMISADGFGDLVLNASGILWRNRDVLPSTFVEGRFFVKAPTGDDRRVTDGILDKHVQPGTGSWDLGFGLAATHKLDRAVAYASALYRINNQGSLDYAYGDVALLNAAVLVPLGHATGVAALDRFTPGLELNFRWAAKDVFRGADFEDSGGSILYITPSLRLRLPWPSGGRAPSLRAAVQLPVTSAWLNGFQEEDPVWSVGVLFPF